MQAIGNIAHNLTHIIEKRSEMTNKMYVGIDKILKKINWEESVKTYYISDNKGSSGNTFQKQVVSTKVVIHQTS